jgi:hypothetical protein
VSAAVVVLITGGCQSAGYKVLAATGTNIGVELSQNPATQSPQAKLGYQRVEMAFVPTNRSSQDTATAANSLGKGAPDVADVIMELRYGGIFSTTDSSIYQRLAVGPHAVAQPGASFMFAKKADGSMDAGTAQAVAQAHVARIPAIDTDVQAERKTLGRTFDAAAPSDKPKWDAAAKAANQAYERFVDFLADARATPEIVKRIREELTKQGIKL